MAVSDKSSFGWQRFTYFGQRLIGSIRNDDARAAEAVRPLFRTSEDDRALRQSRIVFLKRFEIDRKKPGITRRKFSRIDRSQYQSGCKTGNSCRRNIG